MLVRLPRRPRSIGAHYYRELRDLSFLSPAIPGPERYLAGRPLLAVTLIFVQIVVTLVLVGVLARRNMAPSTATWPLGRRIARERAS